jgi:hypothetical protein
MPQERVAARHKYAQPVRQFVDVAHKGAFLD